MTEIKQMATAPRERLWAYLATLPVVLVAMNLLAQLIK